MYLLIISAYRWQVSKTKEQNITDTVTETGCCVNLQPMFFIYMSFIAAILCPEVCINSITNTGMECTAQASNT